MKAAAQKHKAEEHVILQQDFKPAVESLAVANQIEATAKALRTEADRLDELLTNIKGELKWQVTDYQLAPSRRTTARA